MSIHFPYAIGHVKYFGRRFCDDTSVSVAYVIPFLLNYTELIGKFSKLIIFLFLFCRLAPPERG